MRSTARVAEPGPGLVRVVLTALAVAAAVVLVPAPSDAAEQAGGATLSGRLVKADGSGWNAEPWIVAALPVDAGTPAETAVAPDGTFVLSGVGAGSYRLRAHPTEEHSGQPVAWLGGSQVGATVVPVAANQAVGDLVIAQVDPLDPPSIAESDGRPYVNGTPKVGWTLTAHPQNWTLTNDFASGLPVAPEDFTYQWVADGVDVPGATAKTFTPTARELGKTLAVRIGIDIPRTTLRSEDTSKSGRPVVAGRNTACSRVTLAGTAKVGRTLTARRSRCWTAPGTRVTHTWYVDGRKVGTTTRPTIRLRKAYRGDRVSVKVTAKAPGYATTSVRPPARKVR